MLIHTVSIVARCSETGKLGIALCTADASLLALGPIGKHGVGAIATQGWTNPRLGKDELERMAEGASVQEVLNDILAYDPGSTFRQIGIVDRNGKSCAFTGTSVDGYKGHLTGRNYSIQGYLLRNFKTLEVMEETFVWSYGDFVERLIDVLDASEGDDRYRQLKKCATVQVFDREGHSVVDLRVENQENAIWWIRQYFQMSDTSDPIQ